MTTITLPTATLAQALKVVLPAIPGKSSLPVLSNVLMRVDGTTLTLTATNLEIGIVHRVTLPADGGYWALTVPAKTLSEIIAKLPGGDVTMQADLERSTLRLTATGFRTVINGIDADEFPSVPTARDVVEEFVSIPMAQFQAGIRAVAFCASPDDARPVLQAVHLALRADGYTMTAADGYRLAQYHAEAALTVPTHLGEPLLIPGVALREIAKLRGETIHLGLTPGRNQIVALTEDTALSSRMIEGLYPDVGRIIPQQDATRVDLNDPGALRRAAEVVKVFMANEQGTPMHLRIDGANLIVSTAKSEIGEGEVNVTGYGHAGPPVTTAVNVAYLLELLPTLPQQYTLGTGGTSSPVVFRAAGLIHIIMPMSIRK
jgi:DNA polymerase-3 subunit beta